jgi:hypothetical protein
MKRFLEVVDDPEAGWDTDEYGYVMRLPHGGGFYEIRLEALLFGQFYLAVYEIEEGGFPELVGEKVPVRPGGGEGPA